MSSMKAEEGKKPNAPVLTPSVEAQGSAILPNDDSRRRPPEVSEPKPLARTFDQMSGGRSGVQLVPANGGVPTIEITPETARARGGKMISRNPEVCAECKCLSMYNPNNARL